MATDRAAIKGMVGEPADLRSSTRDLLLRAASDLMRERDSLEFSLSEIAHRAGVNAALVKYYFGSKNGLRIALIDRDLTNAISELHNLMTMDTTPSRKMKMHLQGAIRMYFQYPYLDRLVKQAMRDSSEEVAQEISDRFLRPIVEAYEATLTAGVAAGEFRAVDPKLFYFTVIGACDQIFSARSTLKYVHGIDKIDDDLRRAYAEHTARLIMNGLCA